MKNFSSGRVSVVHGYAMKSILFVVDVMHAFRLEVHFKPKFCFEVYVEMNHIRN